MFSVWWMTVKNGRFYLFEVEICSWSFHIGCVHPDPWTRKGHSTCLLEQGRPEALVPFGIVKKEGRGRKGGRMENEILSWSISLFQKGVKLPAPLSVPQPLSSSHS